MLQLSRIRVSHVGLKALTSQREALCFWYPSWLWVIMPEMEILVRLCLCLFYLSGCGLNLFFVVKEPFRKFSGPYQRVIVTFMSSWEEVSSRYPCVTLLNSCVPFMSVLHYYWWEVNHHLYHCFFSVLWWFSSNAFRVVYFFGFKQFYYNVLGVLKVSFFLFYLA